MEGNPYDTNGNDGTGDHGRLPCNVTPAEARVIAKEAYIYGFPMVDDTKA
jgi:hypothetical protein